MKHLHIRFTLLVLLLLSFVDIFATQDSLIIYTKAGCSNCHEVKQIFTSSGINFKEMPLENIIYANEMLNKLAANGYRKDIYLPVIFLNNQLLHPAYTTDKGLISIELQNVVDTIRNKFKRGELDLATTTSIEINNNNSQNSDADCEIKVKPLYLICETFNTEQDAIKSMNIFIENGYSFAGIVFYNNKYQVFSKFFYDYGEANTALNKIRTYYKDAFLIDLP